MKRLWKAIKCLLILVVMGVLLFAFLRWQGFFLFPQEAAPEVWEVFGVDVSAYQGQVDWNVLAGQGVEFAFIKATEGSGYADRYFEQNWLGAQRAGLLMGAYHFFSYDSPGETQADNFIKTVPVTAGALPPVVDIEFYGDKLRNPPDREEVKEILDPLLARLEEHYGQKPILYVTYRSYRLYIKGEYEGYPLWVSRPLMAPIDKDWSFWQYSHSARLGGYTGDEEHIDLNVFRGSLEELKAMTLTEEKTKQENEQGSESNTISFTAEEYFQDTDRVSLWAENETKSLTQLSDFAAFTGYDELRDPPEKVSLYTRDQMDGICVETFSFEPGMESTQTELLITGEREGQTIYQEMVFSLRSFGFYHFSVVGGLRLEDANFDGELDLLLSCGGNRGTMTYVLLLWDEEQGQFVYEPSFSVIPNSVIDKEHYIIWGGGDPGYGCYYYAYELVDGAYVRTHALESERIASESNMVYCEEYEGETQIGRIEFAGDFYQALEYYISLGEAWEGWQWCNLRAYERFG